MDGGFALRITRLTLYLALTLSLMPVQGLLVLLRSPLAAQLPYYYHRACCRILGFRIEVRGAISDRHPTLFVCNHVSYADIPILGALIRGSFVAKTEVATWPLLGWLAKLQRTVFVDRRVRSTARQRGEMASRLLAGDDLILFPEGTSGDGNRIQPFKSALFGAAEPIDGHAIPVQPMSVAYVKLDGIPIGRTLRAYFAWYGDMELAPHLWTLVGLGTATVVVEFYPVVTLAELGSRKALAEHCHRVISEGMSVALAGRPASRPLPRAPSGASEAALPTAGATAGV
jgi:1-acyl-sn-glycerol-3-phosphate acyltransferase